MVAITILIACKNMADTLGETLEGIAQQDWDRPWEVILADNGSTDGSAAVFEAFAAAHPDLLMRLVDASDKPGKSHALNRAAAAAAGRAILLNDADDVMAPGYLARLGRALDDHDLVGGGNDFTKLNRDWVLTYRGHAPEVRKLSTVRFPPFLPFVGGNSMGFTKALFEEIGGFRSAFEPMEDLDFCFRAQQAGRRIEFVPDATMHYRHRSDPVAIRRQSFAYARCEVKLAKEYRDPGAAWAGPWRRYLRAWVRLAGMAARQIVRSRGRAGEALISWHLGWQLGQTAGMLKFKAPPSTAKAPRWPALARGRAGNGWTGGSEAV